MKINEIINPNGMGSEMRDRPRERNAQDRAGTGGYTLTNTNATHCWDQRARCPGIAVVKDTSA